MPGINRKRVEDIRKNIMFLFYFKPAAFASMIEHDTMLLVSH
jgi:hypothetical protein